jgi:hypothetical protein
MLSDNEEKQRNRASSQIDLIKGNLQQRNQTVVTVAVSSIAVIGVSGFIKPSPGLTFCISILLALNVVILWWHISNTRKAIVNSQNILNEIMGPEYQVRAEKIINRSPWYQTYFAELVIILFTIIVSTFIVLLFVTPNTSRETKLTIFRNKGIVQDHHRER